MMDPRKSECLLMGGGEGADEGGGRPGAAEEGGPSAKIEGNDAFDDLLEAAGSHSKFQIRFNAIFNFSLSAVVSMSFLNYVMAMTVPDHWCHVPGAEGANVTAERWKELTLPRELGPKGGGEAPFSKCKMFNVTVYDVIQEQYYNNSVIHKEIVDCQFGWDYDKTWYKRTAPSDNDWVCDDELRVTNTFMYARIGDVVGAFIYGQLGDTIGRKKVFVVAIILLVLGRIAATLSSGIYPLFAASIFLSNSSLLPVFLSPLAIGMEFCCKEKRSQINMLQCVGWTLGISFTPLFAWAVGDWKTFTLATSMPTIIFIFIIKLMPESPRWLMTRGRPEEALRILKWIAEVNGRKLPKNSLTMLRESVERGRSEKVYGIASLFSSKRLSYYTMLILVCWGINSLAYYSLVLNVGNMSGNPFLNFFYQSLVELPAYLVAMWCTDKLGRRWTQSAFFILLFIACAALIPVVQNEDLALLTVALAVFAKFSVCITFYTVYLHAVETYPTCLRQTGTSTNSLVASLLGILGPYVIYLGTSVDSRYPFIVLGTCSLLGVVAASFLPETLYVKLPETLAEAQNFGKDQVFWSIPRKAPERTNDKRHKMGTNSDLLKRLSK